MQVALLLRQISHIPAGRVVQRSRRRVSGLWIGATETEQFHARLARQCQPTKDAQQRLFRTWLSTVVRHAAPKSHRANTGQEIGTTGTGPSLARCANLLRRLRARVGE
eukprot:544799-Karenia_brevis.AAC.1